MEQKEKAKKKKKKKTRKKEFDSLKSMKWADPSPNSLNFKSARVEPNERDEIIGSIWLLDMQIRRIKLSNETYQSRSRDRRG